MAAASLRNAGRRAGRRRPESTSESRSVSALSVVLHNSPKVCAPAVPACLLIRLSLFASEVLSACVCRRAGTRGWNRP